MSDSESDDDLRPHQLGRREIGVQFFSDSDMMMKSGTTTLTMASASPPSAMALPTMLTAAPMKIRQPGTARFVLLHLKI